MRQLLNFTTVMFFCALLAAVSLSFAFPAQPALADDVLVEVEKEYKKLLKQIEESRAIRDDPKSSSADVATAKHNLEFSKQGLSSLEDYYVQEGGNLDKLKGPEVAEETQEEPKLEDITSLEQLEESDFTDDEWSKLEDEFERIRKAKERLKKLKDQNSYVAQTHKRRIEKAQKRINKILSPKNVIYADGIWRAIMEGETVDSDRPDEFLPWKLDDWPKYSKRISDKAFSKRAIEVIETPTPWARQELRKTKTQSVFMREEHYLSVVKPMIIKETGLKSWKQIKKRKPLLVEYWEEGVKYWAKKGVLVKDAVEFIEKEFRVFSKKLISWSFIDHWDRFHDLEKKYYENQKQVRDRLLIIQDEWSYADVLEYEGGMDKPRDRIILVEKKLLWLLGEKGGDKELKEELKWIKKGDKEKKIALTRSQQLAYKAWMEWMFRKFDYESRGTASTSSAEADARDLAYKAMLKAKAKKRERLGIVSNLRFDVGELVKRALCQRMKRGLMRSLKLKSFRPHKVDDGDIFYRRCLGEEEYKKFKKKGFFRTFKSGEVYEPFLPGPGEWKTYAEQQNNRLAASRRRR